MNPKIEEILQHIQREKDPIIKARLIHHLHIDQGLRIVDLSKALKYTQTHICNLLRLMKLPVLILDGFYGGLVTYTHLLLLSRLHEQKDMIMLYEKILQQNIPTSMLEEDIRHILYGMTSEGVKVDKGVLKNITNVFKGVDENIKVKVTQTRVKARIVIDIKGNNQKSSEILKKIADLV